MVINWVKLNSMKRYIIINHFLYGTYTIDEITPKELAMQKNDECDMIIDIQNATYFDDTNNKWLDIAQK